MASTLTDCNGYSRDDAEALLREFMPYAKKAGRNAMFKWDLDPDDVMQSILMEAWRKIDKALVAETPIAWLRQEIRYVVGKLVQERYWRKGNGITDQLDTEHDTTSAPRADHEAAIDISRALGREDAGVRQAFYWINLVGLTNAEAGKKMGVSASGAQFRVDRANEVARAAASGKQLPTKKVAKGFIYYLKHEDGREVRAKAGDACELCGFSASTLKALKAGKLSSAKGWKLA